MPLDLTSFFTGLPNFYWIIFFAGLLDFLPLFTVSSRLKQNKFVTEFKHFPLVNSIKALLYISVLIKNILKYIRLYAFLKKFVSFEQ